MFKHKMLTVCKCFWTEVIGRGYFSGIPWYRVSCQRVLHRWMSANKWADEHWTSQRCFFVPSPQKRAITSTQVMKAAEAFEACGRTRRQIHLSGHWWPNLVEIMRGFSCNYTAWEHYFDFFHPWEDRFEEQNEIKVVLRLKPDEEVTLKSSFFSIKLQNTPLN